MVRRVPIISQGDLLIAAVQEELSDSDIQEMQNQILLEVARLSATKVILDVSLLDVIDSFGTRMLSDIAASVMLRGAKIAIVGIRPEIAMAMVLLGLKLENIPTALNLDHGIAILRDRP
ncbi:STAS domain-containing protein [Leisingera daeponensis]|uniref:STAS domain-containing protein n=1 Tax=Leisingera daeponensis TaxID=405746 RepID=UPI0001838F12|nr:STAS domain-containing protein [Leisingera daeponensis]EDZ47457.1 anti-sigma-factor antagonist [Rhodobacterales bacterium Y4I]